GTESEPQLGGAGEPIEYALRMVQFSQSERLDHLLNTRQLTLNHMDELALMMAQFHQKTKRVSGQSLCGTPEIVCGLVKETLDQLKSSAAGKQEKSNLGQLERWFESQSVKLKNIFEQRKQNGFVRECHGDAHLANMVLFKGEIILFDCIEFSENLRWIDTASEMAFTVMDLESRMAPQLAARFLNQYLEITGDYEALSVLFFYKFYRALVRAKVSGILISHQGLTEDEKQQAQTEYKRYLDLAKVYTQPPKPILVITHGISGTGKTTHTASLLEELGAIRLRSDVERKRMFGLESHEKSDAALKIEMYSVQANQRVYEKLIHLARRGLENGLSIIVDGTFLKYDERKIFKDLAAKVKVPFVILDFTAPVEILRERIQNRLRQAKDASEADTAVLDKQLKWQEPLTTDELADAIAVSPQNGLDAKKIRSFISP
ncbi:MAG: hypothetical protein ACD_73C00734G0004, partial [uncultured bacterium]